MRCTFELIWFCAWHVYNYDSLQGNGYGSCCSCRTKVCPTGPIRCHWHATHCHRAAIAMPASVFQPTVWRFGFHTSSAANQRTRTACIHTVWFHQNEISLELRTVVRVRLRLYGFHSAQRKMMKYNNNSKAILKQLNGFNAVLLSASLDLENLHMAKG